MAEPGRHVAHEKPMENHYFQENLHIPARNGSTSRVEIHQQVKSLPWLTEFTETPTG